MKVKPRILYLVNVDWFFISHRLPLALAAKSFGFEVIIAASNSGYKEEIESYGMEFIHIPFSRKGTNLLNEILTLIKVYRVFRKIKPDIVHQVTIKPVIFGSLIARFSNRLSVVNAITGLGFVFSDDEKSSLLHLIINKLYKIALNNPRQYTIFQNPDDRKQFIDNKLVNADHTFIIMGSGVDCEVFKPSFNNNNDKKTVLFASRMIWDKGVNEFYEAAKIVKKQVPDVEFVLAGMADQGNPNAVKPEELIKWTKEGYVKWIGHTDNMLKLIQSSTIVVLPTYYPEGVPKILIEAAACGKPIVTTNRAGCREIVRDGINGILVPQKDSKQLAGAILEILNDEGLAKKYGVNGREIVLNEFSEKIVVSKTMEVYKKLVGKKWPSI
ncbi:MAG: glycosyltransferase family 4 protein [Balneolia bacterium]|nr:glycosyltransferase family 4 protein [Balneolia bacterium]